MARLSIDFDGGGDDTVANPFTETAVSQLPIRRRLFYRDSRGSFTRSIYCIVASSAFVIPYIIDRENNFNLTYIRGRENIVLLSSLSVFKHGEILQTSETLRYILNSSPLVKIDLPRAARTAGEQELC